MVAAVVEEERMLRLAEQCLERAKSFIGRSVAGDSSGPHQTAVLSTAPDTGDYKPIQAENLPVPANWEPLS